MSSSSPSPSSSSSGCATSTTTTATRTTLEQRQCDQCVLLLQQVLELEQSESKPAQLLRSMSATATASASATNTNTTYNSNNKSIVSWRKTPNGIQVEIPVASTSTTATTNSTATVEGPGASQIIEVDPPDRNESAIEAGNCLLRRITSSTRQWTSAASTTATQTTPPSSAHHAHENETAQRLAATSTRTNTNCATSNDNVSNNNSNTSKPKTEWLSLQCRPCLNRGAESNARAFVMGPAPLSVVVCSNRLQQASQAEMAEIITHELVHIFDVRKLHLNLLHCPTLAYSEVRAAREAECSASALAAASPATTMTATSSWFAPFAAASGPSSLQHCVRQKATVATRNLFPERAQHCIDAVFDQAFADQRPFVNNQYNHHHNNNDHEDDDNTKGISSTLTTQCRR